MSRPGATRSAVAALAAALVLAASATAAAQPAGRKPPPPSGPVTALVGATVHTGTGEVITDAVIVVANGEIRAVGKGLAPPAGAQVVSLAGAVVTPGLVDATTSVGLVEVDLEKTTRDDREGTQDRIRAAFRAADGFNPASTVVAVTRSEGVTSVGVVPTGGLVSGQSAWADLGDAASGDLLAKAPLALHVHVENDSDATGGGGHGTALLRIREAFDDARTFARTKGAWERNQSRPFAPSRLDLEALAAALDGKLPVVFHVDRAVDIERALAVAKEFSLRAVVAGGAEAWRVAGALAAAKVPVVLYPLAADPSSFDRIGARDDTPARLVAAGVTVALSTGETHNARKLRQVAGNAVRGGMPYEQAIVAITRSPAVALGTDARYGTVAAGKVANLVVWSGDPLELSTDVKMVFVRGRRVSLESRQTALRNKYRKVPR